MENAEFVNKVCEVVDPTGVLPLARIVKLVVEKFTAEHSKGLGTANKQSTPCHFEKAHLGMKDSGMLYCGYCGIKL